MVNTSNRRKRKEERERKRETKYTKASWHAALWATMKKNNISTNLIRVIKSPFNIFLERIMTDAVEDNEGTVSIGGRAITSEAEQPPTSALLMTSMA